MDGPPDVDPGSIEDFERAVEGLPRPIPDWSPAPEAMVREIVETFGEVYRYDPDSEVPRELHESEMLVLWTEVEPEVLRRLQVACRELEDRGLRRGDEWISEARLQEWAEGAVELLESTLRRMAVEAEIATDLDGMIDVDRLIRGLSTVRNDADSEEG